MKRTKQRWLGPVVAASLMVMALGWGSNARATVMVELLLEDMARDAAAIVHGRVVRSSGHLAIEDDGAKPYTLTTLEVREWIKGVGGERVVIREFGGAYGGGGRGGALIDGVPEYRPGEEVVVFLEVDPSGEFYRTYGMVQGKFVVQPARGDGPTMVVRDAEAVTFARWIDGQMTLQRGELAGMSLATFLDVVEQALRFAPPLLERPDRDGRDGEVAR